MQMCSSLFSSIEELELKFKSATESQLSVGVAVCCLEICQLKGSNTTFVFGARGFSDVCLLQENLRKFQEAAP